MIDPTILDRSEPGKEISWPEDGELFPSARYMIKIKGLYFSAAKWIACKIRAVFLAIFKFLWGGK